MKRIFVEFFAVILALLLSGCGPKFPTVESAYISPVNIRITPGFFALSPDGKTITIEEKCGEQIDLQTGNITPYPYQDYTNQTGSLDKKFCIINRIGGWSPDGRYLAITEREYDQATMTVRDRNRIIDTRTRTIQSIPGQGFWVWSPFNTGTYLTRSEWPVGVVGVYNMYEPKSFEAFTLLDGSKQYDFTQEIEVGGVGEYLWSKRLDIPIAWLTPLRDGKAVNMRWRNLAIESFFEPGFPVESKYQLTLIDDPTSHIVGAIFDPSGEYVLVAEWECAYTDTSHCNDTVIDPPHPSVVLDGITDSVFTLIHWRTGKKRELFHLSSIDPQNVIASGDLYWSADGSTIVLGRINASLVVLKMKYP